MFEENSYDLKKYKKFISSPNFNGDTWYDYKEEILTEPKKHNDKIAHTETNNDQTSIIVCLPSFNNNEIVVTFDGICIVVNAERVAKTNHQISKLFDDKITQTFNIKNGEEIDSIDLNNGVLTIKLTGVKKDEKKYYVPYRRTE